MKPRITQYKNLSCYNIVSHFTVIKNWNANRPTSALPSCCSDFYSDLFYTRRGAKQHDLAPAHFAEQV